MPPLLPKQRILLPDKAFVVTVLHWELREPFLLQLPGDVGQIFFFFAHAGFQDRHPQEKREQRTLWEIMSQGLTGSTRERLNGSCFSQPYPNGELAIQMTSREEPGFVIVFCSMGCAPLASLEINSAWLTLAPWLPWTEILQSKLRFPTPGWDHDAGRHLVRHPNFYRCISEIVFQRGVCGSLAVKFILRLMTTF